MRHYLDARKAVRAMKTLDGAQGEARLTRRHFATGAATAVGSFMIMSRATAQGSQANSRIKAGVIGLGGRGRHRVAKQVKAHGGYEITALADYFEHVVNDTGEEFGVDGKNRFHGLGGYQGLIDSGVEAVFLQTPPYCFPDHARAATDAGLHIYIAKPVACDVPGCMTIKQAAAKAKKKGKVFLADFQTRTDPLIMEGVRRVQASEVGDLKLLRSLYTDDGFRDPPLTETVESRLRKLTWVNDVALGGGMHVNCDIHSVDLALWLAGEQTPLSATGHGRRGRPEPHGDSNDVTVLTYEFGDGLLLHHTGEHMKNRSGFECECFAYCENGHLEAHYNGLVRMLGQSSGYRGGEIENLYARGIVSNVATFHQSIIDGDCANPTVEPSVNATLVTILGREAAKRGGRLAMDELLRENERIEPDLSGLTA